MRFEKPDLLLKDFRGAFSAAISIEEKERGATKALSLPGKLPVGRMLQKVRAKGKEASKLCLPTATLPALLQSLFLCLLLPLLFSVFGFSLFLFERFTFNG